MEIINQVKLRLEKFIRKKVDRSIVKPLKIIEEKGHYYLILKKLIRLILFFQPEV